MKIGVIGSGTMGRGIAQVFAQIGAEVILNDINKEALDKALEKIDEEHRDKVKTSTDINLVKDCDVVIEAVIEDLKLKKDIFKKLDEICDKNTILATNTSSISITEIASATNRADKVIGMHFMNPVPIMKLVEIIRGEETSDEVHKKIEEITEKLDKVPATVSDSPGFVSNRILMPFINEAVHALKEGIATKEDIDTVAKLGFNHPIGPLKLADLIGLDICLNIMNVLYENFKDEKYKPCPLLVEKVEAGKLGRKTKEGFYEYKK